MDNFYHSVASTDNSILIDCRWGHNFATTMLGIYITAPTAPNFYALTTTALREIVTIGYHIAMTEKERVVRYEKWREE